MRKFIILTILVFIILGGFLAISCSSQSDLTSQEKKEVALVLEDKNLRYAELAIDGMTCSGCAVAAENALKKKDGVVDAKVGFFEGKGEVIYNPKLISIEEIVKAVEPYKANVIKDEEAISTELKDLPK